MGVSVYATHAYVCKNLSEQTFVSKCVYQLFTLFLFSKVHLNPYTHTNIIHIYRYERDKYKSGESCLLDALPKI